MKIYPVLFMLAIVIGNSQGHSLWQNNSDSTFRFEKDTVFTFESEVKNKLPEGWDAPVGAWAVFNNNGNKVLRQTAANSGGTFNIAVFENAVYKDLAMSVKIKAISGKGDQGGGLIWRYIDQKNYYVVRENPLEDNVVLYKVLGGKRTDLALVDKGRTYGVSVPKLGNDWNSLKVVVRGDLFTVYLNEKQIFQVKDKTFTAAGKIGVWSKADAASYFDDLSIQQIK